MLQCIHEFWMVVSELMLLMLKRSAKQRRKKINDTQNKSGRKILLIFFSRASIMDMLIYLMVSENSLRICSFFFILFFFLLLSLYNIYCLILEFTDSFFYQLTLVIENFERLFSSVNTLFTVSIFKKYFCHYIDVLWSNIIVILQFFDHILLIIADLKSLSAKFAFWVFTGTFSVDTFFFPVQVPYFLVSLHFFQFFVENQTDIYVIFSFRFCTRFLFPPSPRFVVRLLLLLFYYWCLFVQ